MLAYAIGATLGPLTASWFMYGGRPGGLFVFIGLALLGLGVFAVYRLIVDTREHRNKAHFAPTAAASGSVFPGEHD